MTDEVLAIKRKKRKSEKMWRKLKLVVHLQIYESNCAILKKCY